MNELDSAIAKLREELRGYHVDINLYPSGGIIDVYGCEQCGTSEYVCESISFGANRNVKTFSDAVEELKKKLEGSEKQ